MSAEKTDQETSDDQDQDSADDQQKAPSADNLSDEGKKQVEEMQEAYNDDRETAVLPGTDGTITGVAVNEWLDDDGNPKFGKDENKDSEKDADGDTAGSDSDSDTDEKQDDAG